ERVVSLENALRDRPDGEAKHAAALTAGQRDRLAVQRYAFRSRYLTHSRVLADVPLAKTQAAINQRHWFDVAEGKGALVLQELRQLLGDASFEQMMDSFGRDHAGKEVTSAEFQMHAERQAGKPLREFFDYWLQQPGLPTLGLGPVHVSRQGKKYRIEGT